MSSRDVPFKDNKAGVVSQPAVAAIAMALLVLGAGLRSVNLDQPLLNFHATRQYRSALLARACYYDNDATVPEQARRVARANRALQPVGEPQIMEWLACQTYRALGSERLVFPRAYAASFWLLGALPLVALAQRVASAPASLVALALYLFLPYGVDASRAFMPDPLMTCCVLWAILALARYYDLIGDQKRAGQLRLLRQRGLLAALAVALALVVKPMSIFLVVPAAIGLAFGSDGRALLGTRASWPLLLGLVPAVAYYGYEAVFGTLARDQMRLRFVPSLIPTTFFWNGLATQVQRVFSVPVFVAAVAGTLLARPQARALLIAVWIGYAAFAVAFTYHMPTHDYYHLPYIALIALAIAALADRLRGLWVHVVLAGTITAWGAASAWLRLQPGSLPDRVAQYEEIGEIAEQTEHAIFLDVEYGYPLMYHAHISGDSWPSSDDLAAEALGGAPSLDAAERFARDYDYGATHFIVTDIRSLNEQPDLQRLLADRAAVVRQTPSYHVYRLK